MAESIVEICNSALTKIGAARIDALTDDNERARACNERYNPIRKEVLRLHPWNFATYRVALGQDSTTPAFDYLYRYTLPSDVIRIIDTNTENIRWVKENSYIYTDATTCKILYIKDEENTTKFDSMFDEVLATRLASDIVYRLVQNNGLQANMFSIYKDLLREARLVDAIEGEPRFDENYEDDVVLNQRY